MFVKYEEKAFDNGIECKFNVDFFNQNEGKMEVVNCSFSNGLKSVDFAFDGNMTLKQVIEYLIENDII